MWMAFVSRLHIRQTDRPNVRLALPARDFFRADRTSAEQYGTFKQTMSEVSKLAAEPDGPGHYLDLKDPFVALLIILGETWATQTGWTLPRT